MANVQRELVEAEKIIFDELVANGYPKESIILEGKLDTRRFVDFIVIDIDTKLSLMMIEVKSCSEKTHEAVRQVVFKNLKNTYDDLQFPIKAIGAILDRGQKKLEFIDFTNAIKQDDFNQAVNNYSLPPYEILVIGARQKAIDKQQKKQEKKIVALRWLCWLIFPLICLALVLLDAFNIYTLSSLRLITIGVGAAVALIPCLKEIKFGELVIKMMNDKSQKESKDA